MTNPKELNLGDSDFKSIIENDNYFIDKSMLIKEVIKAQKAVLLLPRPRRFGKTLNLSMLKYFFDKNEPENKKLFTELKIWQTGDDIKQHCGKYPVIYLSFKDAKEETWEDCYELIIAEIVKLYRNHRYLLEKGTLYEDEKNKYNKILNEIAKKTDYQNSIKLLSGYLQRYHKEKVIILVDEYDTPIQAGYKKYYNKIIPFMRNLLSGAYKDNTSLYKGVITGILRVSRESIFTGLNNITVHSILDEEFSDKFGFTEPEVKQILKDFKTKTDYSTIKYWYDGYKIGDTENIYNPWSILNFAVSKKEKFKTYWTNTSTNELIKDEIKKKDASNIRKEILKLISGETVTKDLEENFVFTDLKKRKSLIWTLLAYSGYLTTRKQISRKGYELIIPNSEIKTIFQDTVIEWFESEINIDKYQLIETFNYLTNNEIPSFEKGFKQIIGDTFSYYNTAKTHEYVYQSYMLGLLAIIGDDYIIKSDKESGDGRYDIMLIPHDKSKYGVVIEIKQIEKLKDKETNNNFVKRINKSIKKALAQIDKNKYYKELIDSKIEEDKIIKLPIVFAGKEPYIIPILMKNK